MSNDLKYKVQTAVTKAMFLASHQTQL